MTPPLRPVDLLVLLTLEQGARHGYGIRQDLLGISDGAVALDAGNLYRCLNRLQRQGLLEREAAGNDDDPRRRNYRLTEHGRDQARSELRRLERLLANRAARALLAEAGG